MTKTFHYDDSNLKHSILHICFRMQFSLFIMIFIQYHIWCVTYKLHHNQYIYHQEEHLKPLNIKDAIHPLRNDMHENVRNPYRRAQSNASRCHLYSCLCYMIFPMTTCVISWLCCGVYVWGACGFAPEDMQAKYQCHNTAWSSITIGHVILLFAPGFKAE